ncbi:hypothetical protein [Pseudoalteromonas sp. MelDa3]|uniref:hypothetical protein n=1 Tax=Pseudoalteromonas sp. MelDa3 TaxID=888435 RepID=UPI000CC60B65|nr:hypothetical protein [Pseudoalteromonas sp. MelDa3]PLT25978.1 hypothetical protein CXF89_07590 [Pseudoalteromonas sp. MelDa3]
MEKFNISKTDLNSTKGSEGRPYGKLYSLFLKEYLDYLLRTKQDKRMPKRVYTEVWYLFAFLSNPTKLSWMVSSKIWLNEDYRKKQLACYIVKFPEMINYVEERICKLNCSYHKLDLSISKNNELPSLEIKEVIK